MAFLAELGVKYPCSTEGQTIAVDENTEDTIAAGEVAEIWFEADDDIDFAAINSGLDEIIHMKDDYPDFSIHYLKFETRKIIVQFSVAPPEGISAQGEGISTSIGLIWWQIAVLVVIITGCFIAALSAYFQATRGWVWHKPPAMGDALVVARNAETDALIANVEVATSGETGATGPNGEGYLFQDLVAGDHIFTGSSLEGFQDPMPVTQAVKENQEVIVTIWYNPVGYTPPPTGVLNVDTSPVKGVIFLNGVDMGIAPQSFLLDHGSEVQISYGAIDGYVTPPQETFTIQGGKTDGTVGIYTSTARWYEKFLWYSLLGVGIIAGSAIVIPKLITSTRQALSRPRQLEEGKG